MFGGINGINSNEEFFTLDMNEFKWEKLSPLQTGENSDDWMKTRDEHAACAMENEMIVFGGFKEGERCNEIHAYGFNNNTWRKIIPNKSSPMPCARAGHSISCSDQVMLVFGGKDDENQKLNDLWKFDFSTKMWEEMKPTNEVYDLPTPRAGHSAIMYKNELMMIFGGIYEITRELNDCHIYSIKDNSWHNLYDETGPVSPVKEKNESNASPLRRKGTSTNDMTGQKPTTG